MNEMDAVIYADGGICVSYIKYDQHTRSSEGIFKSGLDKNVPLPEPE
jgi:hypothetical protein